MTREELRALGERMREQLGQQTSATGALGHDDSAPGFAPMMSEAVYGGVWSRPGLTHRQRLLCAIAAFTALGLEPQLVKFSQAAMDNGFARAEVIEAIIQTAPYAGFPRALNALGALSGASC